jgi:menaquinone-specific isochorismate synthase
VPFFLESTAEQMTTHQLLSSLESLLRYALINPVYIYGFWDAHEGILGATPEKLFRLVNHSRLETMACAGTSDRQADSALFLRNSKELYEHRCVVQGIIHSLSPFGDVDVGELQLLKLSQMIHLVTPIQVALKMPSLSFEQLVRILHPTPALGTFPPQEEKQWLTDYQKKIDRQRFGAPVGYICSKTHQCNCYVSIRNVQWSSQGMFLGAGCGIVPQSQIEAEWSEINLKLRAIKEMLAL